MPTTVTVTKPAAVQTVHARLTTGHYHRFETGITSTTLQDPANDNAAFNGTTVTFSAGSGTITPTFPAGITQIHVLLTNSHYYRFESSGQVTTLENGDVTGSFQTLNFATS
jgi:hypothetical protein